MRLSPNIELLFKQAFPLLLLRAPKYEQPIQTSFENLITEISYSSVMNNLRNSGIIESQKVDRLRRQLRDHVSGTEGQKSLLQLCRSKTSGLPRNGTKAVSGVLQDRVDEFG